MEIASLPPLAAQLLHNRGITDPTEAEAFLRGDERLQGDPFLLPDMEKAVARIYQALLGGELIAIYGDFDADGICGIAVLTRGLSLLGGNTTCYIPHRIEEGYGLNSASLESLRKQGVTLVITVDCGISNLTEVDSARKSGLDIIITDHHVTPPALPPALAVVDPKREDSLYPFSQLAGVGVAFKLLQGLFQSLGKELPLEELLDVVALGTVADMVPLLGENRYLVKRGLKTLSRTRRLGLQELVNFAGLSLANLNAEDISWVLVPRLNAPGRLDHALPSYRLLVTDSSEEAHHLALELAQKNTRRQRLTEEFLGRAKEQLSGSDSPLLIAGGEDFPQGITGLIAGRLTGEFYRPSIVFELGQSTSTGSARSIAEFDIAAALEECRDLLIKYGGHAMAAGFTLPTENLAQFQERLLHLAAGQLSGIELYPFLTIDAKVPLSSINGDIFKLIERFAPFGQSNPLPTFLSPGVRVMDSYPVGNHSQHLKMKLREGDIIWPGIGFNLGHLAGEVTPEIDLVYNLTVDRWNGADTLGLNIHDFASIP
ncbi:single-stranded-DNA-specific exonuclease RecJ [Chloroflexota bacterium]